MSPTSSRGTRPARTHARSGFEPAVTVTLFVRTRSRAARRLDNRLEAAADPVRPAGRRPSPAVRHGRGPWHERSGDRPEDGRGPRTRTGCDAAREAVGGQPADQREQERLLRIHGYAHHIRRDKPGSTERFGKRRMMHHCGSHRPRRGRCPDSCSADFRGDRRHGQLDHVARTSEPDARRRALAGERSREPPGVRSGSRGGRAPCPSTSVAAAGSRARRAAGPAARVGSARCAATHRRGRSGVPREAEARGVQERVAGAGVVGQRTGPDGEVGDPAEVERAGPAGETGQQQEVEDGKRGALAAGRDVAGADVGRRPAARCARRSTRAGLSAAFPRRASGRGSGRGCISGRQADYRPPRNVATRPHPAALAGCGRPLGAGQTASAASANA